MDSPTSRAPHPPNPVPVPGGRRLITTGIGSAVLILGSLGLLYSLLDLVANLTGSAGGRGPDPPAHMRAIATTALSVGVMTKCGLISMAILMLHRRPLAFRVTLVTMILSVIGTILQGVLFFQTAEVFTGGNSRDAATPVALLAACLFPLSLAIYVSVLVFLRRPATRAEWSAG